MPDFKFPVLPDPSSYLPPDISSRISIPGECFFADELYDRIQTQIKDAEREVAADGKQLVLLYQRPGGQAIQVQDIGFHNTSLIILTGVDSQGQWTRVLVHVATFQLVMTALPVDPGKPRRTIGFRGEISPAGSR